MWLCTRFNHRFGLADASPSATSPRSASDDRTATPPDRHLVIDVGRATQLTRAKRRVVDAETEFDAALAAGLPLAALVSRDHELQLAIKTHRALL